MYFPTLVFILISSIMGQLEVAGSWEAVVTVVVVVVECGVELQVDGGGGCGGCIVFRVSGV